MSEWGFISPSGAKSKFEIDPDVAAETVSTMSMLILNQEKEISDLKDELILRSVETGRAQTVEARLIGYIERVREMDKTKVE